MIVSQAAFVWIVSLITSVVAVIWIAVDAIRIRQALGAARAGEISEADKSDRIFGSFIGITVALIGIIGVLKYHLGG